MDFKNSKKDSFYFSQIALLPYLPSFYLECLVICVYFYF